MDCQNDYVEFRDANVVLGDPKSISGEYGPILTNRLCGSTKPSSIQSQGNIVWVQFKSNSNSTTVYKGFKATFKAGIKTSRGDGTSLGTACDAFWS